MADFARVTVIRGEGAVFAVDAQGNTRRLKEGDVLQQGETIRTTGTAQVELMMEDGRLLAVSPGQSLRLDEQVADTDARPDAAAAAVASPAAIDTVIQALERGVDLSTELEAAAAGLGAGAGAGGAADSGTSFVQLLRVTEGVTSVDYNFGFDPLQPPGGGEGGPLQIPTNDPPVATDDTASMSEGDITVVGNVLPNDSDPDGDTVTVAGPDISLTNADGTLEIDAETGNFTFTMSPVTEQAAQGLDDGESIVITYPDAYQVSDGQALSNLADVSITINGLNDPPSVVFREEEGGEGGVTTSQGTVDEEALAAIGTNPSSNGEFWQGSFVLSDPDGLDDLQSVTINGDTVAIGSLEGHAFTGASGTLRITAYNAASGVASYEYELTDPTTDVNLVDETDIFTITTSDGTVDSSPAVLTITIIDDQPVAVDDGQLAAVDDNASGFIIGTVSDLLGPVADDVYGADGPHATEAFVIGVGSLGGTVTVVGSDLVYTSATNLAPGGTATETFTYTIKDADGDPSSATFSVALTDGGVTLGTPVNSVVDEEGLAGGNAGDSYASGDADGTAVSVSGRALNIDFGSDGPGTLTFNATQAGLAGVTSGGQAVNFTLLAGGATLVGYTGGTAPTTTEAGSVVFFATLDISGTGTYSFTQVKPLDQATAGLEDDVVLTLAYTAADAEGEGASGSFTVTVDDDAPTTVNDGLLTTVDDEASGVVIGSLASLLGDDRYGADGPATSNSFVIGVGSLGGTVTVAGSDLVYTSATDLAPGGTATESFTYTIKDADGDTQTATFSVGLTDGGVTLGTPVNSVVDEEGLAGGNAGDSYASGDAAGTAVSVSGRALNIDFGSDGPGTLTFDATQAGLAGVTSGGQAVNFTLLAGGTTLVGYTGGTAPTTTDAGSVVFFATLDISGTGTYSFTQVKPLDHATAGLEDDVVLTLAYTAADAEGEGASGSFTVTVDDDAPTTVNDGLLTTVAEKPTSVVIGTVGDLTTDDSYGADGPASSDSLTIATGSLGGTVAIVGGQLRYTSTTNVTQAQGTLTETFTYTIKDADGDTRTGTFSVSLTDTGVTMGTAPAYLLADEDDISGAGGNAGGTGDLATPVMSGTISYTLGTDAIGSVTLSTAGNATGLQTLSGQNVVTTFVGGVLVGYVEGTNAALPANQVFTITLGTPGATSTAYTMVLNQPVMHATGANENDTTAFTVNVAVADADGSTGNTSFTVVIDDDTPVTADDGSLATLAEKPTNVLIGTVGDLTTDDSYGADGPASSDSLTIATGSLGGTVAIVGGQLRYTSTTNVTQAQGTLTETFTYTIKDADGDTRTGTFSVSLTDTGVTMGTAPANLLADEDDISGAGGNAGGMGDLTTPVMSGTISYTLGTDAIGSVTLSTAGNATGLQTLSGQNVVTTFVGGVLVGYVEGTNAALPANQVFTIILGTLGASSTTYTMVLNQPVEHVAGSGENDTTAFTVNVAVADADGSTGNTSFTVVIDDDTPTLSAGNLAIPNVAGTFEGVLAWSDGADSLSLGAAFSSTSLVWTNPMGGFTLVHDAVNSTSSQEVYKAVNGDGTVTFFTVTLHGDGTYDFQLVTPEPSTTDDVDILGPGISGGSNLPSYTFDSPLFNGQFKLVVTGTSVNNQGVRGPDTLTISSTDLGVGDNVMQGNKGDALRFQVMAVDDPTPNLDSLTIHVSNTAGFNPNDLVKITVSYVGEPAVTTTQAIGIDQEIVFDLDPSKVLDYIEVAPNSSSVSFKIDDIDVTYTTPVFPEDYNLNFSLTGVDADGDTANTSFTVAVNTTDTVTYTIHGTDASDTYHGTTASDVFAWRAGDEGTSLVPHADTVANFTLGPVASGGDALDLRDLLSGESANAASLDGYLDFGADGNGDVVISVHVGGAGTPVTQTITLVDVDLAALQDAVGGSSDQLILAKLLADGNLKAGI